MTTTVAPATGPALRAPLDQPVEVPLVVDLDGTLCRTDTLQESLLLLLGRQPWNAWRWPGWLAGGRAAFKRAVSVAGRLPVEHLPFQPELLEWLRAERARGRRLVLATGADEAVARDVAAHLRLFDDVLGSDGQTNLTGPRKLAALRARFADTGFVYAGNSRTDLPLFHGARACVLVNTPASVNRELNRAGRPVAATFPPRPWNPVLLLKALRVHQWAKNALVFAPLLLSHSLNDRSAVLASVVAFFAFSFTASTIYITNDLLDLQADRRHPHKRRRPFASGALPLPFGVGLAAATALAAVALVSLLPVLARWTLAAYVVANLVYSLRLKTLLSVDVVFLSLFYTIRIYFGGEATGIEISPWTMAFSVFFFTALALAKRLTELLTSGAAPEGTSRRRAYHRLDAEQVGAQAAASGYLAVLVVGLYLNSEEVKPLYSHRRVLWLVCPLMIYWMSRFLIITRRGALHHDPVVFALRDRASWLVLLGTLALAWLAT